MKRLATDMLCSRRGGCRRQVTAQINGRRGRGGQRGGTHLDGNTGGRAARHHRKRGPEEKFGRRSPYWLLTVFSSRRRCLPPVSRSPELPPKYAQPAIGV